MRTFLVIAPILILELIGLSLSPSPAQAAGGSYYAGLEAGAALLNAGAGSRFEWGASVGSRILPTLYAGFYYSYIPFGSVGSPSGVSVSGSEKFFGAEGRLDFSSTLPGFSAGARAGLSGVSTQATVPGQTTDDESSNGFAWGPVLMIERPISTSMTLGAQLNLMIPSERAANNALSFLATLKFWL